MIPKACVMDLAPYEPGKPIEEVKKEFGLTEVIKLASNENPFGFSAKVKDAIREEWDLLNIYPDGASRELREALAAFLGIDENRLIFGAGSDEVITMLTRAYLKPGERTIMAKPTFSQYFSNAKIEDAEIVEVPLKDGYHDLAAMKEAIDDRTKIVWICSPNNPTGTIVKEEELRAFLRDVPREIMVVVDEAYFEYVTDPDYPDSLSLQKQYRNLIVLRTFSKAYGLSALRVGYGIADPEIVENLNRVRGPFNTTRLSQRAALAALKDQAFIQECKEKNRRGMEQICRGFKELGFTYYPSEANFVMVDIGQPAEPVFVNMLKKGVIVRSGHALGLPNGLRITIGNEEQNRRMLDVLAESVRR